MELKDIMKQRRETLFLTQQDLSEMAEVGLATIKDIERGKGNPSLSAIKKMILKRVSRHGSEKEDENYFQTLQASINVGKRSISVGVLLSKLTSFVLYAVLFIVVVHVLVRLEQEHIIFNDSKYSTEKIMEIEREWIRQHLR